MTKTYDSEKIYYKIFTGQIKGFPNGFPSEAQNNERGECIIYASTFGNYDRQGESVAPGAFSKNNRLQNFVSDGFIALGHDYLALPMGYPMWAKEDDKGLLVDFKFHSTNHAQNARKTMQERFEDGKTVKFSIGYRVISYEETPQGILLTELELFEVSYVNVPANPLADIVAIKGDNNDHDTKTEYDGQRRQPGPDVQYPAQYRDQAQYWRAQTGGLGYDIEEGGVKFITGALVGETYASHADTVLAAVSGLTERTKSIADIRKKEGRVLSKNTRQRLGELLTYLANVQESVENLLKIGEQTPDNLTQGEVEEARQEAEEVLATNPPTENEQVVEAEAPAAEVETVNSENGESPVVQETEVVESEQKAETPETEQPTSPSHSEADRLVTTDVPVTNPENVQTGVIVPDGVTNTNSVAPNPSDVLKLKAQFLRLSTKHAGY